MPEFSVYDGDTHDYIALQWRINVPGSDIIKALMDVTIAKSDRQWHPIKKIWFVPKNIGESFIKGIEALISVNTLKHWTIKDKRTQSLQEEFENFFTNSTGLPMTQAPDTRDALIKQFEFLVKERAQILISMREDMVLTDLKPIYRKAALALHPDRNPENAGYMSELNLVWSKLQKFN